MRQGYLLCLCMVALLVALVSPGVAAPSLLGFTGLLYTPTADVLSRGEWKAHFGLLNGFDDIGFSPSYNKGR